MMRRIALLAAGFGMLAVLSPVTSPATAAPTVHLSEIDAFGTAATATTATSTAAYKFSTIYNSKPVRWNPCQVIHWKFRSTNAPYGGLNTVKAAVARVAYLTGTTWKYDGLTTAVPSTKWLPTSTTTIRPVLIGWTDGAHSDLLRGQPASVLGVTRTAYFKATVNGVPVAATKAAVIALDRTNKLPMTGAVSWKSTMLHELAHTMGLNHVGTRSQMMYPVLQRTLIDLQYGDRTGLSKLGRRAGCVNLGF
jgi:hypothetical protein